MCDGPSRSVVMAHVEPTRLQVLAMTFAEKCAVLLDANERALELHVGAGGAQLFDYDVGGFTLHSAFFGFRLPSVETKVKLSA